jgi:ribosomal protein S18 acetylase RimI-like enzyme
MSIVELAPHHAASAAGLHILGQPGSFLTSLGPEVLTVIYRVLPTSGVGFGFAALAEPSPATKSPMGSGLDQQGSAAELCGFVSATTGTARLFATVGGKAWPQLLPPLLRRFAAQPRLAWLSLQTFAYPLLAQEADRPAGRGAELLSIMVAPDRRGQGVGEQLLATLVGACQHRGLAWLDVTVEAANEGARRFYKRHGFALSHSFSLYGRAMCSYQLALAQVNEPTAQCVAEQPQ